MIISKIHEPIVGFDLETTGIDRERSLILEIGATYYDRHDSSRNMKFHRRLWYTDMRHVEMYAAHMNAKLIGEIAADMKEANCYTADQANAHNNEVYFDLRDFLDECIDNTMEFRREHFPDRERINTCTIAGKNAAGFDLPILMNNLDRNYDRNLLASAKARAVMDTEDALTARTVAIGSDDISTLMARRVFDVGTLFYPVFGYIPTLDEINALVSRKAVTHNALDDAEDVTVSTGKMLDFLCNL